MQIHINHTTNFFFIDLNKRVVGHFKTLSFCEVVTKKILDYKKTKPSQSA